MERQSTQHFGMSEGYGKGKLLIWNNDDPATWLVVYQEQIDELVGLLQKGKAHKAQIS